MSVHEGGVKWEGVIKRWVCMGWGVGVGDEVRVGGWWEMEWGKSVTGRWEGYTHMHVAHMHAHKTQTHVHTYSTHTHTHTYMHAHTHTHTHTHTRTHTHSATLPTHMKVKWCKGCLQCVTCEESDLLRLHISLRETLHTELAQLQQEMRKKYRHTLLAVCVGWVLQFTELLRYQCPQYGCEEFWPYNTIGRF